uniref:Signal peptide-containing protein n=1 Tax=Theileria lestoquardi TaxID=77054 RepID=A0A165EXX7_THELE|nr:hypothetical protein [Theileria lestoquardi]
MKFLSKILLLYVLIIWSYKLVLGSSSDESSSSENEEVTVTHSKKINGKLVTQSTTHKTKTKKRKKYEYIRSQKGEHSGINYGDYSSSSSDDYESSKNDSDSEEETIVTTKRRVGNRIIVTTIKTTTKVTNLKKKKKRSRKMRKVRHLRGTEQEKSHELSKPEKRDKPNHDLNIHIRDIIPVEEGGITTQSQIGVTSEKMSMNSFGLFPITQPEDRSNQLSSSTTPYDDSFYNTIPKTPSAVTFEDICNEKKIDEDEDIEDNLVEDEDIEDNLLEDEDIEDNLVEDEFERDQELDAIINENISESNEIYNQSSDDENEESENESIHVAHSNYKPDEPEVVKVEMESDIESEGNDENDQDEEIDTE